MEKIDILEASAISKQAWDIVSSKTIANCLRKSSFVYKTDNNNTECTIDELDHSAF